MTIVRGRLRLCVVSSVTVKRYSSGTRSRIDIRDYSLLPCLAPSPVISSAVVEVTVVLARVPVRTASRVIYVYSFPISNFCAPFFHVSMSHDANELAYTDTEHTPPLSPYRPARIDSDLYYRRLTPRVEDVGGLRRLTDR